MFPGTSLIRTGSCLARPRFCSELRALPGIAQAGWGPPVLAPALEEAARVVHEDVVYVLVSRSKLFQAGYYAPRDEQVAVGVVLAALFLHLAARNAESYRPVVTEHYASAPTGLNQLPGGFGPALPVGGELGLPAWIPVESDPDTPFEETCQVRDISGVVAVTDVNAIQVNSLVLEDRNLLFADALGRPGMGGAWERRWPSERARRP